MSNIVIQPARLRHLPPLRRQFVDALRKSFTYIDPAEQLKIERDNRLHRLMASWIRPSRILTVAHDGTDIKGFAIGSVSGATAQLYWLYVSPDSRGENLGLKLLTSTLRIAQQKGADHLALSTYDNERYYSRQGFKTIDSQIVHGVEMKIMRLQIG